MHSLESDIEGLLNRHIGEFHSEHGVGVYLNMDGSVFVIGQLREYCSRVVDVGVCAEVPSLGFLVKVLGISSLYAFRRLSIEALIELYTQGRAEKYCSIRHHGDFPLRFRKSALVVHVLDDNDEVIADMDCEGTTAEVISYTYKYFCKARVRTCVLQ